MTRIVTIACVLSLVLLGACAPEVGDKCTDALDCSIDGTRVCDTTQTDGYCLVPGCRANECPEEAVCVQFGEDERARAFCLRGCENDGDCPVGDCQDPDDEELGLVPPAAIIDEDAAFERYCW